MQPLVSIIIPTFNSSTYLKATLDSVLSQTYAHWECILVDDGSTDLTEAFSLSYRDKDARFQLYKRPEELLKGPSSARNYGVSKATGDYLIFLDADDLLAVNCLEQRVARFEEHLNSDFLVFQMERFVEEPDYFVKEKVIEEDKTKILASFIQLHGQWPITGPIYKRSFFRKIGFNPELTVYEDLEVAIKAIVQATHFKIFNTIDCYYRNDVNYVQKYNTTEVKTRMVKAFQVLLNSIVQVMATNTEHHFTNEKIKGFVLESYKRLFRFQILENISAFKEDHKKILHLLLVHGFLNLQTAFKYFLVDRVLLPFATIKGSGIARLIKKIYN